MALSIDIHKKKQISFKSVKFLSIVNYQSYPTIYFLLIDFFWANINSMINHMFTLIQIYYFVFVKSIKFT